MSAFAITSRDLTARARSRSAAHTLCGVAIALGLTVLATYRIATTTRRGTTGVSVLLSTGVGREVVHLTLFVLLVVFCVAVPITAGTAIAGERERGSLGPLLLSGIRPVSVVGAKLLASFLPMVALLAVASPFLAVGYVLGG